MNDDLNKLYSGFSELEYWTCLVDQANPTEIEAIQELIEETQIPEGNRADFYAYILWDRLFFEEDPERYPYLDSIFFGRNRHKRKSRIDNVKQLFDDDRIRRVLDAIIAHWPVFEDHFYADEKEALDKCHTVIDYTTYLNTYPNTYRLFRLIASYRLSILEKRPFVGYNEIINNYPNSIIANLLKRKLKTLKGISFVLTDEAENDRFLQNTIEQLIQGLVGPFTVPGDQRDSFYILTQPISRGLVASLFDKITLVRLLGLSDSEYDSSYPIIASYEDFERILERLSQLSSLSLTIPTKEQWRKGYELIGEKSTGNEDFLFANYEWLQCSNNKNEAMVVATSKRNCEDMFHIIPKDNYATCRLLLHYINN